MKKRNISRANHAISLLLILMANFVLAPVTAQAHGDLVHVVGIVTKVSDTAVSVKTKEGKIIDVEFGDKTTYSRAKTAIDKGAITVGSRIVIHAAKANEKLIAHTVELGAVPAPKGSK